METQEKLDWWVMFISMSFTPPLTMSFVEPVTVCSHFPCLSANLNKDNMLYYSATMVILSFVFLLLNQYKNLWPLLSIQLSPRVKHISKAWLQVGTLSMSFPAEKAFSHRVPVTVSGLSWTFTSGREFLVEVKVVLHSAEDFGFTKNN